MSSNLKTWLLTVGFAAVSLFVFFQTHHRDLAEAQPDLTLKSKDEYEASADANPASFLPGKFQTTKIHDGDTCEMIGSDGIKISIRFAGIDAPELSQEYGHEAREVLRQIIENRTVTLAELGRDKYGRYLAQVYSDGQWVNREMLVHGAAWVYLAGPHFDEFKTLEEEAKLKRVGLWASDRPMSPWEARK